MADSVAKLRGLVCVEGRILPRLFDREQRATHGLAWLATYLEAIRQLAAYADHVRIGFGEYLAQIFGGITMSQGEITRLRRHGPDLQRCRHAVDRPCRSADCIRQHGATARASGRVASRQQELVHACGARARVSWAAADGVVQVHGANGVAVEFPVSRILADARVLSILEGSAEILAQMVARRMLEASN